MQACYLSPLILEIRGLLPEPGLDASDLMVPRCPLCPAMQACHVSQVVSRVLHQSTEPSSDDEIPVAVAMLLSALSGRMQDPQVWGGGTMVLYEQLGWRPTSFIWLGPFALFAGAPMHCLIDLPGAHHLSCSPPRERWCRLIDSPTAH